MPEDAESTVGAYRVFCAYPKSCGAEAHVDHEPDAKALVREHEEKHDGRHTADYEEVR